MKPLAKKWLHDIGSADGGRLGAHIGGSKRDLNACQSLLEAGLIKIETAFEGGLYLIAITDAGRERLAADPN